MNEPVTDRELLELAARAAGLTILPRRQAQRDIEGLGARGLYLAQSSCWNPLTDDGDALRLAVKLSLEIAPGCYGNSTVMVFMRDINAVAEPYGDDANAATRRAITRAAAEIGRGLATNPDSEKP